MSTEPWLAEFATRLQRAGLPREYVTRSILELNDHSLELRSEPDSAGRRGITHSIDGLADEFVRSYRSARWHRRLPSWSYILLPLPLSMAICLSFYLAGMLAVELTVDSLDPQSNPTMKQLLVPSAIFYFGKFLTPLVSAILLLRILKTAGRPAWVRNCSTLALAAVFFATYTEMSLPTASRHGSLILSIESDRLAQSLAWQCLQAITVLATACVWRLMYSASKVTPM